jgi:hypothetical protein
MKTDQELIDRARGAIEAIADALTAYQTGAEIATRFHDPEAEVLALKGEKRLNELLDPMAPALGHRMSE